MNYRRCLTFFLETSGTAGGRYERIKVRFELSDLIRLHAVFVMESLQKSRKWFCKGKADLHDDAVFGKIAFYIG